MPDLLPCPCCGSRDVAETAIDAGVHIICCRACGTEGATATASDSHVDRWNRRHPELGPEARQCIELLTDVLAFGAQKHRPEGAPKHTIDAYLDKAERHITRGWNGQLDPETGLHHLAHAAADLLLAVVCERQGRNDG